MNRETDIGSFTFIFYFSKSHDSICWGLKSRDYHNEIRRRLNISSRSKTVNHKWRWPSLRVISMVQI